MKEPHRTGLPPHRSFIDADAENSGIDAGQFDSIVPQYG
jgi:hypothetical protein